MSILILLYFFILLTTFLSKDSKIVTYIVALYMFCIFAFNTGNVDYDTYVEAFYKPTLRIGSWEIGFVGLMTFLYDFGLEISALYFIVSLLYVSTVIFVAKNIAVNKVNHFLCFFLITTFLLHVVQLRFSSALIFVLWGFWALLKISNKHLSVLIFLLCIFVASCFHVISVLFCLYLLPFYFDIKKTYLFSLTLFIVLLTGSVAVPTLFSSHPLLFRISTLVGNYSSSTSSILRFIGCLIEIIIYILMFRKIHRFESISLRVDTKRFMNDLKYVNNDFRFSEFCYGLSIASLILIPLLLISTELHRILSVVNILLLSAAVYFTKVRKLRLYIYVCLIFIALIISYFYIWGSNYDKFVFIPVLTNNSFFN